MFEQSRHQRSDRGSDGLAEPVPARTSRGSSVVTHDQLSRFNAHGYFSMAAPFGEFCLERVVDDIGRGPSGAASLERFCLQPLLAGVARAVLGPHVWLLRHGAVHVDATEHATAEGVLTCWISLTDQSSPPPRLTLTPRSATSTTLPTVEVEVPSCHMVVMDSLVNPSPTAPPTTAPFGYLAQYSSRNDQVVDLRTGEPLITSTAPGPVPVVIDGHIANAL